MLDLCKGYNQKVKMQRESTAVQVLSENENSAIIEMITRDAFI